MVHQEHIQRDAVELQLAKGAGVSVIELMDALIATAVDCGTSDIHIEPGIEHTSIRFRIDGLLSEQYLFPYTIHAECIARLKVLSGLRTDEHYAAQDGRFRINAALGVDVRLSIIPTFYGENAVLRLLPERSKHYGLDTLGFSDNHVAMIRSALTLRSGMILVTGPTGSGKTTTLYALMEALANESLSLVTIEDPIEYAIHGTTQIPVHAQTGLTFAEGLRSLLRQDPDIIMVGEIRDAETAALATNAALTGHLVLSTLHTINASTTFARLLDLLIPPFIVSSTVRLVIAQRLVRKICDVCYTNGALKKVSEICKECNSSGFNGRIGIYEVIEMTEVIEQAILERKSAREITAMLEHELVPLFRDDATHKIAQGLTTAEEVYRVTYA